MGGARERKGQIRGLSGREGGGCADRLQSAFALRIFRRFQRSFRFFGFARSCGGRSGRNVRRFGALTKIRVDLIRENGFGFELVMSKRLFLRIQKSENEEL